MLNFVDTRKVKIVCTLGPATDTYDRILRLARAGMDVARFNFSHGTYEDHQKRLEWVRKASIETKKPIAILQDLQGPKIRVRKFEKDQVELKPGARFTLTVRNILGNDHEASVSYATFNQDVSAGSTVLLDDGNLSLKVVEVQGEDVHCEVVFGGILKNNKGVNLPGSILSVEALTEKDKEDLKFGLGIGVDYIALSFVQRPEDVKAIKELIYFHGKDTPVIAKIEKPQAVDHIDEIIELADGIMIARGDMGVEMNVWEVPPIQKDIISRCNRQGKPVITATQMLESMIQNPRPTRAEATDVANAVLDGTDAVMLSAETASGAYPFEAVEHMHKIISTIEARRTIPWKDRKMVFDESYTFANAVGESAGLAAAAVNAAKIVCLTDMGYTAKVVSHFRPTQPILAVSPSEKALRQLALFWGVWGVPISTFGDNIDDAVRSVTNLLKNLSLVQKEERVVFTAALPFTAHRDTNMLRIETVT
ncbi:MAG: pyruvate kinase [Spirochaetales bacterium]|nr:pyruvate kinase [Spirochaetales bacterium]